MVIHGREPDWSYVARSVVKVLTVTAALLLTLTVGERALEVFVDVGDRTAQVYGTAARIANPDKRLSHGYTHSGRLPVTTFTMRGEPRRAGPSDGTTEYKIVEGLFGTVQAPLLDGPSGSLADAIDSVEAKPGDGRARATLDGLPPTLVGVGVVEFAHKMTTEQLVAFGRRHKICGGDDVAYIYEPSFYDDSSDPSSLNAIVWNRDMTREDDWAEFAYQCETEPERALAEFRRWVGLLDENDDLEEFELAYGSLKGAADEGVTYGLVFDRWKLADLRKLLDDPDVGTIHLADVAFDLDTWTG
ncbi:hypothetical protein ACIBG8_32350 [Nonomuraea sp. NPDC050556]|uniref:hypothetical protein n=1 Tax=Nonomuraea sp. NPDC050556 TaxID=3364369 RepID=UPI0037ABFB8B